MLPWRDWVQDHLLVGVGIVVVAGTGLAAAHWVAIAAVYPVLVGGVLALCGINKGAEVAYDTMTKKTDVTPDPSPENKE
jgi:hypothetical protein